MIFFAVLAFMLPPLFDFHAGFGQTVEGQDGGADFADVARFVFGLVLLDGSLGAKPAGQPALGIGRRVGEEVRGQLGGGRRFAGAGGHGRRWRSVVEHRKILPWNWGSGRERAAARFSAHMGTDYTLCGIKREFPQGNLEASLRP
jgi:hypothetical protein